MVSLNVLSQPSTTPKRPTGQLSAIDNLVAVASGKGGVGKSTVAVNLALAMKELSLRVGIVDADILGPSVPTMLGLPSGQPPASGDGQTLIPTEAHGVKAISMGMFSGHDQPAILRGPMVSKYLHLFFEGVAWGELDCLIIDLPPGTGDTQLTLAQQIPLAGAIIVTTPQDVSLNIARRGLRMFQKVNVPILGIVENMSGFVCPHCDKTTDVFRSGGGLRMGHELGVPFLGAIPLDAEIVLSGDQGVPIVVAKPKSRAYDAYIDIATTLITQLGANPKPALRPFVWNWSTGQGAPSWLKEAAHKGGDPNTPIGLRKKDAKTLEILWSDGTLQQYNARNLRLACPCALCLEEMTGRKILDSETVKEDIEPRVISSVGRYAITIQWTDGHSTGIYHFERLREKVNL
ncbi:MAG: P-loop NTPase [Chloroflexi bacterium]|nr:P-loop NTPase [Chloroflexota bacterium]